MALPFRYVVRMCIASEKFSSNAMGVWSLMQKAGSSACGNNKRTPPLSVLGGSSCREGFQPARLGFSLEAAWPACRLAASPGVDVASSCAMIWSTCTANGRTLELAQAMSAAAKQ